MNTHLTRLGVPPEIQAFFNIADELVFDYGDGYEHFGDGFHKIPTTQNLWLAGSTAASKVIITYSAMEAIAFITFNRHRYPRLEHLAFIAIGNWLHTEQSDWIRQNFPKRKFTLVFGKNLLGHITAIKLAAGIRNIPIQIFHSEYQVSIYTGKQEVVINDEQISLHTFQEKLGIRPRFRTGQPIHTLTFLDQLQTNL